MMPVVEQTLTEHYRELSDDALLRIALDRHQLTLDAAAALDAEFSVRYLTMADAETIREGDRRFDRRLALTRARSSIGIRGIRSYFFGHWHVQKRMGAESYTATKFFVLFGFPLIPLGTYRLLRWSRRRWWEWILGRNFRVMEKLALDWNQVLWTWCKATALLYALILTFRYYAMRH